MTPAQVGRSRLLSQGQPGLQSKTPLKQTTNTRRHIYTESGHKVLTTIQGEKGDQLDWHGNPGVRLREWPTCTYNLCWLPVAQTVTPREEKSVATVRSPFLHEPLCGEGCLDVAESLTSIPSLGSTSFLLSAHPTQRPPYRHRDIPRHVHVGLEIIHPHLRSSQRVTLGIVVNVVVVWLLGPLNVGHAGAGEYLHAAATLPHLG